jgi:hypothetical protein
MIIKMAYDPFFSASHRQHGGTEAEKTRGCGFGEGVDVKVGAVVEEQVVAVAADGHSVVGSAVGVQVGAIGVDGADDRVIGGAQFQDFAGVKGAVVEERARGIIGDAAARVGEGFDDGKIACVSCGERNVESTEGDRGVIWRDRHSEAVERGTDEGLIEVGAAGCGEDANAALGGFGVVRE